HWSLQARLDVLRHPVWSQPNAVGTLASRRLRHTPQGVRKIWLAYRSGPRRDDSWHEACFVFAETVAVQRRPAPRGFGLDRADARVDSARDDRPTWRPPLDSRLVDVELWRSRIQNRPHRAYPRQRRWLRPRHRLDGPRGRWRPDRPGVGLVDHGRWRAEYARRCAGSRPLPYRSGSRGHALHRRPEVQHTLGPCDRPRGGFGQSLAAMERRRIPGGGPCRRSQGPLRRARDVVGCGRRAAAPRRLVPGRWGGAISR